MSDARAALNCLQGVISVALIKQHARSDANTTKGVVPCAVRDVKSEHFGHAHYVFSGMSRPHSSGYEQARSASSLRSDRAHV
jgi:hypothetical protein